MAVGATLTDLEKTLAMGGFATAMADGGYIGRNIDKKLLGDLASDMFLKGMEYQKLLEQQKAPNV